TEICPTSMPASRSRLKLFSVPMIADACLMPGSFAIAADNCMSATESRYSRGMTSCKVAIAVFLILVSFRNAVVSGVVTNLCRSKPLSGFARHDDRFEFFTHAKLRQVRERKHQACGRVCAG